MHFLIILILVLCFLGAGNKKKDSEHTTELQPDFQSDEEKKKRGRRFAESHGGLGLFFRPVAPWCLAMGGEKSLLRRTSRYCGPDSGNASCGLRLRIDMETGGLIPTRAFPTSHSERSFAAAKAVEEPLSYPRDGVPLGRKVRNS
jgi:hypothetical protein